MSQPSDEWFAGVLDARGQISVQLNRHQTSVPLLGFAETSDVIPRLFSQRFGGKVRYYAKQERFTWRRTGKNAQLILRTLRPLMRARCAAVDRLLRIEVRSGAPRQIRVAAELLRQAVAN